MSKYTTGELAKLCGVTVRTVQYYDSRNILVPSELSEGGRRLYSKEDLHRLKIICFLRDMGLPIESIRQLLNEKYPDTVISILLEEQSKVLKAEVKERQEKLQMLEDLKGELKHIQHFTVDSIGDIAYIMENKKKLRHLHGIILAVGLVLDAIETATLMIWILEGIWQPFAIGMLLVFCFAILLMRYYLGNVVYICPCCHTIFKPKFWKAFWANHTAKTRKLTCVHCNYHGFCIESYGKEGESYVKN